MWNIIALALTLAISHSVQVPGGEPIVIRGMDMVLAIGADDMVILSDFGRDSLLFSSDAQAMTFGVHWPDTAMTADEAVDSVLASWFAGDGVPPDDNLRRCTDDAVRSCTAMNQQLCWVYLKGGKPPTCLFACKVDGEPCPPAPNPGNGPDGEEK